MVAKKMKVRVSAGNEYFDVRKNGTVVIYKDEAGRFYFDELEGFFKISTYNWEPGKDATITFCDIDGDAAFTIGVVCNDEINKEILAFQSAESPQPQTAAPKPAPDAATPSAPIKREEGPASSGGHKAEKELSMFSVVGMVIGGLFSIYGVRLIAAKSALDSITFGGDFYTYMYKAIVEVYEQATNTAGAAIVGIGIIIICYFGNHLYKNKS